MKTNQRIIIILMFMMMAGLSDIYAQNKREIREQREQAIKEQIIAEKYKISVKPTPVEGEPFIYHPLILWK